MKFNIIFVNKFVLKDFQNIEFDKNIYKSVKFFKFTHFNDFVLNFFDNDNI